ncbi:MAG TPA: DUF1269 domain-containing protein [Ktedonobacterales bacterium]|nr:DUF1269 domain-containing protein [Ktedonobacterales bacterium]
MSDLVAITYPDINQAQKTLETLKGMVVQHLLDLDDAVYVTKDGNGAVDMHQMINLPAAGAVSGGASGALWGTLIGLLFLSPLAGAAIGAAVGAGTGAIAGKMSDYGIDDNFVKELTAHMTPNSSAIFVLVRNVTVDKVVPEISKYGGTVLRTSLSEEAEQRLQAALTQRVTAGAATQPQTSTPPDAQLPQA